MSEFLQQVYNNVPVSVQNIFCTMKGLKERRQRLGETFGNYLDFLKQSEWYSINDIRDYQEQKLAEVVRYAYENVPYYYDLFNEHHIRLSDIKGIEDIQKIPILTKEDVRNNYSRLLSRAIHKRDYVEGHTSGSTGKALRFSISKNAIKWRWAVWFRHKSRFGISHNDSYATFTGLPAVPLNQRHPPFWRENYAMRQTIFTMHHINPRTVKSIVDRLNKGGFMYYTGYPSIIFTLANCIEEAGLEITSPPKVIFTGAESLYADQRQVISRVFKAVVTDQYGFSEGCGNASRCENDLYHEDFEYGILECGQGIVRGSEKTGKILATGFTNLAMPLIRYEVGDTATWVETRCKCGRHSKTIKRIEGRSEDFIITPEGNKVLRFDYIFKNTVSIKEAQVIQRNLNEIIIRIVKRDSFSIKDEKYLLGQIKDKISLSLKVSFKYVNEIERGNNGKFRAVRSYLKH